MKLREVKKSIIGGILQHHHYIEIYFLVNKEKKKALSITKIDRSTYILKNLLDIEIIESERICYSYYFKYKKLFEHFNKPIKLKLINAIINYGKKTFIEYSGKNISFKDIKKELFYSDTIYSNTNKLSRDTTSETKNGILLYWTEDDYKKVICKFFDNIGISYRIGKDKISWYYKTYNFNIMFYNPKSDNNVNVGLIWDIEISKNKLFKYKTKPEYNFSDFILKNIGLPIIEVNQILGKKEKIVVD